MKEGDGLKLLINPHTGKSFREPRENIPFSLGEGFIIKNVKFRLVKILRKGIVLGFADPDMEFNKNETNIYGGWQNEEKNK